MAYSFSSCRQCQCVSYTPQERCDAIQRLVRPWEVQDIAQTLLKPGFMKRQFDIAQAFKNSFAKRTLTYFPDPPFCDRWCPPLETLRQGGGDCDDLAILAASLYLAVGIQCSVVVGTHCNGWICNGHAWVEGRDANGWFLFEATSGDLFRFRPPQYQATHMLRPGMCAVA